MEYFGKIDFTVLCRLWNQHKELFEMVDFKDGPHALLKANFNERQQPDDHGNTHYLQAACKKADRKEGVNYYIGSNFKLSQNSRQQTQSAVSNGTITSDKAEDNVDADDLPF